MVLYAEVVRGCNSLKQKDFLIFGRYFQRKRHIKSYRIKETPENRDGTESVKGGDGMPVAYVYGDTWQGNGGICGNGKCRECLADTDGIPTVVSDAGHGGDDPGKIGINGAPEKDINLRITEKLRQYLEADGIRVVLTRETEDGLYDASAPNKKVQDMKRRIEKIEQTDPVLTVSIHQNSYPEEYVHGAQVFYYNGSSGGEQLAGLIQTQLVRDLDPENHRQIKPNDSYYLLKKTKGTIVIVECGFLSNAAEAGKLCDEAYQDRVAWSIHKGILQYINGIQRD